MTLRELRQQSGKTAKEVADKLGVTRNAVINYECGVREIGIKHVLILSELYDCTEREVIEAQLHSIAVRSSD
ncbi:MAG: helix-turn-helix transcriptional regulator [Muribaculaceae bacterium]|nr:helix-turn-helix transcriptional regulator [Muribaculaceae bacterium]